MKKIFISILFCLIITENFSQNKVIIKDEPRTKKTFLIYHDAKELHKTLGEDNLLIFDPLAKKSSLKILKKYYVHGLSPDIKSHYANNPFINNLIPEGKVGGQGLTDISDIKDFNLIPSKVLDYNVTNISEATAEFMVKRFKEELTVDFFVKMKNKFDEIEELQYLFPATSEIVNRIESYELYMLLPSLRNAFENDILNLANNIPKLRNIEKYKELLNTEEGEIFIATSLIISGLKSGTNLPTIIDSIANDSFIIHDSSNLSSTFKLINLTKECLQDTVSKSFFIDKSIYKELLTDKKLAKIFLGLVYQRNLQYNIQFRTKNKTFTLKDILTTIAKAENDINDFLVYLTNIKDAYETMIKNYHSFNKKSKDKISLTTDDYRNYLYSIIALTDAVVKPSPIFREGLAIEKYNDYTRVLKSSFEAYANIENKQYKIAVVYLTDMLNNSLFDINIENKFNSKIKKARSFIIKYGYFIASVAEADSSEEIEKALSTVVLPTGTSVRKTDAYWSITINSYLGLFAGLETIKDVKKSESFTYGMTAPIGIGFYRGIPKCKNVVGNIGIFLSFFDIGSFTSFRLKNDSANALPEVTLQNILAPGAYLIAGRIFNSPIALSAGIQYGPQLRSITINNAEVKQSAWRYTATLTWDIPLFEIYSRPRYRAY